ncbi:hypothetical protein [Thermodesulfovibrio sp.]|uniref:hypothetical protein n=1 Tax=Thermodesulfovibrio sp. TaxID=2067987 RepID=UPI0030978712
MERLTKETLAVMSKEELQEAVEMLQTKLEVAEREIETLKADAEIGKKYVEHLKAEALRLVRAVEGESSPLLKLIDRADVDTLRQIVDEYLERGKEKFKAVSTEKVVSEEVTKETLLRADYSELIKLRERFINE